MKVLGHIREIIKNKWILDWMLNHELMIGVILFYRTLDPVDNFLNENWIIFAKSKKSKTNFAQLYFIR
ncbi:unnamed protein product [Blepharisma stoltei]|uniref:Uncharacterized protein n=1 Tax=Blepharisma stoltei TaxID=1481888 RepID=A0AAU9JIW0_9CILI|nr:unnamed protein product [Blepharisma stoltei]